MARQRIDDPGRNDAELITAVRAGETTAYEELYRRHVEGARAAARGLTRDRSEADDLVSEAFARVLAVLQRGGGPEMAFRPYLVSAVRNVFLDRRRKDQRLDLSDDVPEDFNRSLLAAAAADESPDRELVAKAFASLPERWQLVLWHTEVEGRSAAEVAPLLGLAPNAVAALGYRAREGLRQAYLNAHIQASTPEACRPTIDKLGAYVRDDISARDRRKVEEHLEGCDRCTAIVAELRETSTRLRGALIPLVIGIPASVYVANLGGGGLAALFGLRPRQLASNPAAVAGAVAAAAVVVVGAVTFAVTRLGDDGGNDDVGAPAGVDENDDGQGGGGGGQGEAGTDPPATVPPATVPTVTVADPSAPSATATVAPPGGTSAPAVDPVVPVVTAPPPGPTAPGPTAPAPPGPGPTAPAPPGPGPTAPAPPPTAPGPGPTVAPPPTAAPTTVPPTPALLISVGAPSPAIAGFPLVLPFTVTNGATPALAAFGRSAGTVGFRAVPAGAPFIEVTAPPGVTFSGPDTAAWTCAVTGARTRCSLPALADGASTSVGLVFDIGTGVTGDVAFTTAVGDGTASGTAGPPILVTVTAAPGVDDLVVDRASVTAIGNTVVTCLPLTPTDPVCAAARAGTATPPTANDKQNLLMVRYVDGTVAGASTSSSATLTLPAGAPVLHARLVWAGELSPGPGGLPPVDAEAVDLVQLVTPDAQSAVTADDIVRAGSMYRAAADVTDLVADGGPGRYTVADVQVATGPGVFGSWALLVVYGDDDAPRRAIALSTGFSTVGFGSPATVTLGGLPSAASRPASVTLLSTEGDRGLSGERVLVNGVVLANDANPADNPFNGSISPTFPRDPDYANNFGLDIDRFALTVSGPTVTLRAESSFDRVVLGPVAIAVDLDASARAASASS